MPPPEINFLLQLGLILGFALYFAWGLYSSEAKKKGEYLPLGQRVRETTAVFTFITLTFALFQAIRYQTWQPIWVLGSIALLLGGIITLITIFSRRP
jgi:magnesium-transporting ATPase (P-type)